jgi:hypothetical protein
MVYQESGRSHVYGVCRHRNSVKVKVLGLEKLDLMSFQVPKTVFNSNELDLACLLVRIERLCERHSRYQRESIFMDQMEINDIMSRVFEDTTSHG